MENGTELGMISSARQPADQVNGKTQGQDMSDIKDKQPDTFRPLKNVNTETDQSNNT